MKGGKAKCASYETIKIYIIFNVFSIFYFTQNNTKCNTSDNEEEVTEIILQQEDNASSEVVQQIEKN